MLCEIWAAPISDRLKQLLCCLSKSVRVSSLDTGAVLQSGQRAVEEALTGAAPWPAEAALSVFMESSSSSEGGGGSSEHSGGATLALHVYDAQRAPGLTPRGFSAYKYEGARGVVVLYRVSEGGQIDHIWVTGKVPERRSREGLVQWELWGQVVDVVRSSLDGLVSFHCNDYHSVEDKLGLGLATTSCIESWQA